MAVTPTIGVRYNIQPFNRDYSNSDGCAKQKICFFLAGTSPPGGRVNMRKKPCDTTMRVQRVEFIGWKSRTLDYYLDKRVIAAERFHADTGWRDGVDRKIQKSSDRKTTFFFVPP